MSNLSKLLLTDQTQLLRFWFGLASVFFGLFLIGSNVHDTMEYVITIAIAPPSAWASMFFISGSALIYGAITSKYSRLQMFLEGILGTFAWVSVSITGMISQGTVGAVTIAAAISIFLLIRYPVWRNVRNG